MAHSRGCSRWRSANPGWVCPAGGCGLSGSLQCPAVPCSDSAVPCSDSAAPPCSISALGCGPIYGSCFNTDAMLGPSHLIQWAALSYINGRAWQWDSPCAAAFLGDLQLPHVLVDPGQPLLLTCGCAVPQVGVGVPAVAGGGLQPLALQWQVHAGHRAAAAFIYRNGECCRSYVLARATGVPGLIGCAGCTRWPAVICSK
jgi:hypothetical protein